MEGLALARMGVAVLGTLAATYYDLRNNRTVPDWLTFGMVAAGVLAFAVAPPVENALQIGGVVVLVGLLGFLLYRMGQIGGADVLLFVAIGLLIPEAPEGVLASGRGILEMPFIISLFLVSGMLFAAFTITRYAYPALEAVRKGRIRLAREEKVQAVVICLLVVWLFWLFQAGGVPGSYVLLLLFVVLTLLFFTLFKKYIAEEFFITWVGVKEIDEEDVLAVDEMNEEHVKKYGLVRLLTKKEIERLKKLPMKKYPVYKNLPAFTPYILMALALSLIFGDLMRFLLMS